jgi:tetratricopeptide (TPR) repeat protein
VPPPPDPQNRADREVAPGSTPAPAARNGGGSAHARGFVGREPELLELAQGLGAAGAGDGRLFLIGGEPGIGKSRLADELAEAATRQGFQVLWGRCWEAGGAPAYWPWVQSIRSCIRDRDPERVRLMMATDGPVLARILPELADLFANLPAPPPLDADSDRFRLFDATTRFLRRAAEAAPLLLVLDDLHAGDVPSLLLLRFLAGELAGMPVLVVGLYRHTELEPDHPVASVLTGLGREQATRNLLLGGLAEAHVTRFVEMTTGVTPHRSVAATIHRQSEGNALFMGEIVRLLAHEGRLGQGGDEVGAGLHLPAGVRQVIGQRMRHLSAGCSRVLAVASVLGREFDLAPLERMCGLGPDELLGRLGEAESAKVITGIPGMLGRMRFGHALIRDAFYEDLAAADRRRLHRQAAETIEELCAADRDPHLAELAHHFVEAAPGGEVGRAVDYARAAADRAARLLAFEEAARLYRMALRALALQRPPDPALRYEILMSLGDVQMRANQIDPGCETFLEAVAVARGLPSPTCLARAALGYGGRFVWIRGASNPRIVPLLREALASLDTADSELRTRLLARLAGALRDEPDGGEREALSREAVAMARRIGDAAPLAYALDGRYAATWEPGNSRERLGIALELTRVAALSGDPERALQGHHYQLIAHLELGEIPAAYAALNAKRRIADELRQPPQRWYVTVIEAFMALFEGRFTEGEALMEQAISFCPDGFHSDGSYRYQLFLLRREQGRLAEMESLIRRSVDEYTVFPGFRAMLTVLLVELGREAEARQVFDAMAARDFADLPWDCEWLHGTTLLAEVACSLGDLPRAATLYQLMEPYAHFNVVAPAEVSAGSVSRALGLLATALSRWDEAERRFIDAIAMNETMGARPWVAHSRHDYGRMLLARDRAGDRDAARAQLRRALTVSRELGMTTLTRRIERLLEEPEVASPVSAAGPPAAAPAAAAAPATRPVFRREGEYWTVRYEGDSWRMRDTKGARYLARLLASPSTELHALDLVGAEAYRSGGGPEPGSVWLNDVGDAGLVLDSRARAEYRKRLEDLDDALEEARLHGDFARAARAEQERELILRELSRAAGLGGRDRRAASAAERARVNVTRAIKATLRKIERHSPPLGRHLASTVRTGAFCVYTPDTRVPIRWDIAYRKPAPADSSAP